MRVSTAGMHQSSLNQMMNSQERVNKAMEQISSGKKNLVPSDNPIEAHRTQLIKNNDKVISAYQLNNTKAENTLASVEDNLTNISQTMRRIKDLTIQATNGTVQKEQRDLIAIEVRERLTALKSIANRRDSDGNYMFAGFRTDVEPYTYNGSSYEYHGDAGERSLQVGSNSFVPVSVSGYSLFENVKNGNGTFVTTDGAVSNTGTAMISTGQVVDESAFNNETYSISFVTNASAKLAYTVTGSVSGQLIPVLPGTLPNDAPDFINGGAIQFAGIVVNISGDPKVGDDFAVEPSQPQNLFNTIDRMLTAMAMPTDTDVQRSAYLNVLDRENEAFEQAVNNVGTELTKVGSNMNVLQNERVINEDLQTYNSKALTILEDIDVTEAISRLSQEMNALQMAQMSYSKIQQLSLLNFL